MLRYLPARPHRLSQAERLRTFPRRLGQFPLSVLAKSWLVPAPPVTSAPASPHHLGNRKFRMSLFSRPAYLLEGVKTDVLDSSAKRWSDEVQ